ncbi:reverse transcriptase domain-containing protein [Tanacetum coccineum]
MVNQEKGTYEARQPTIKEYLKKTKEVLRSFDSYTIEHIRRNQNKKADALSKLALMTFEHLTKEVLVEVLTKRSIDNKEVLQVEVKEGESWMTPIHEYLLSGLLPEDLKEPMKIRIKSPQYKLIKGSLYKKSFFTPWLRCIVPPQVNNIIKEIHEGNTKLCKMQGTIYGQESSEERSNSSMKRMAIQPLGSQHSRTLTNGPRRFKVFGNSSRALYKMGRSKGAQQRRMLKEKKAKKWPRSKKPTIKTSYAEIPQTWQRPHIISEVYEGELYKIIDACDHSLIQTAKGTSVRKFYM